MSRELFEIAPPRLVDTGGPLGEALLAAMAQRPQQNEVQAWQRAAQSLATVRTRLPISGRALTLSVAAGLVFAVGWYLIGAGKVWVAGGAASAPVPSLAVQATSLFNATQGTLGAGRNSLPGGTVAELSDQGVARWSTATQASTRVTLERGALALSVAPRPPGSLFEVVTPRYAFRVRGTRFTVALIEQTTKLEVTEGQVEVWAGGALVTGVSAGRQWQGENAPPALATTSSPVVAPVALPSAPAASEPARDSGTCQALARAGAARDAVSCYEQLALGQGLQAELAEQESARLKRDVLGDLDGALSTYRKYLSQHPAGAFTTEASVAVVELLVRLGRYQPALDEAERLLNNGRARERAAELHLLRARVYHQNLGDLARALSEYARAAESGARFRDSADSSRAECLERLGRTAEAIEIYRSLKARPGSNSVEHAAARLKALGADSAVRP